VARQSENYKPLLASAMELALDGIVSFSEVMSLGEGDSSGFEQAIYM
jgi:MSHA biogenesis protein MshE